ncbi:transcriptional repressor LexA [Acetanaerobacterium elongatum]|uniref:LexA repressor n=1 Tax=Acetanaerobacterium elongatum TaxID=258515 RepID=A0A1H0E2A6_9FIRM|nr:transcriptional repressor LexA [Acetanaerobacterium elongatum]SDN76637.1 SOS-response transcriptional repressor, LexA [Acetanaerobacterium elongatum]
MRTVSVTALRVYEYIVERAADGVPPSVREICTELQIKSTSTVHKYLKELESAGYIEREYNQNRSIKINTEKVLQVPILGNVAAGTPILAIENIEGYVPFRAKGYRSGDLFALNVRGDSMIECGILDGDIVIARKTTYADNGEIVVALLDDSATVKRFFKEKGHFRLQPENERLQPIIVNEVAILGRVIANVRLYE